MRGNYHRWTAMDFEKVRTLAAEGISSCEVASEIGVSSGALRKAVAKAGIRFHGRGGRKRTTRWERVRELAQTHHMTECARILGIHHTTAFYISRQLGFKFRPYVTPRGNVKIQSVIAEWGKKRKQEDLDRVDRMMQLSLAARRVA